MTDTLESWTMSTRADVEREYGIRPDGIIASPGKFEAEPWYAPIVWDWVLNGFTEDHFACSDTPVAIADLSDDDRALFELDATIVAIAAEESDQGFVSVATLTQSELDELIARLDAEIAESDESEGN